MKMLIKTAAKELGVSPSLLRWLELNGKLTPTRTVEGLRIYDSEQIERLKAERKKIAPKPLDKAA